MGFIRHWRGHLREYGGRFVESMLVEEVTLDAYLGMQYSPELWKRFPEQAQADRDAECRDIQEVMEVGDTLWLWESQRGDGGLALRRGGRTVLVWLVWQETRPN